MLRDAGIFWQSAIYRFFSRACMAQFLFKMSVARDAFCAILVNASQGIDTRAAFPFGQVCHEFSSTGTRVRSSHRFYCRRYLALIILWKTSGF